jgi:ABC-type sugar transport system permease subunit
MRVNGADKLDIPGEFWLAFLNTWRIWLPTIVMQLAIALFLSAVFTNTRLRMRGVGFFRALFYFPNLVAAVSVGIFAFIVLDWQGVPSTRLFMVRLQISSEGFILLISLFCGIR